jgi:hypothetical protein
MLAITIDTDVGKNVMDIYKGHHIPLIHLSYCEFNQFLPRVTLTTPKIFI